MITSEEAAVASINVSAAQLKLAAVKSNAFELAQSATQVSIGYLGYLAEVLSVEVEARHIKMIAKRIRDAQFPRVKNLEDFNTELSANTITPPIIGSLLSGDFIDRGNPLVLLGDSGTGKSHLLIGTGMQAAKTGKKVRYVTCAGLVNELAEAASEKTLTRVITKYSKLDLLCLDELGYVHLDPRGAELLFQIITAREEKGSIAVASNAPFSEWGKVFTDARLVAAVIDRLTFNATIIECGTKSFRLQHTKSQLKNK